MSNAPRNTLRSFLLAIAMLFLAGPLVAQIQTSPLAGQHETAVIIAQTSSGGSNTYLIDPLSKKVIGIIEGLGLPHGITVNPEGSKYYVSNEHDISVDVVDARSLEVIERIIASCPIGSYSWIDNWGNRICKSFSSGKTKSIEGSIKNCPTGTYRWADNWGNSICKSWNSNQQFHDTSKGCPIGSYKWKDSWGNPICKSF